MAAKVRMCADGCGQAVVGGYGRRFAPGHAPNYARELDASTLSEASVASFWSNVRIYDNGMCLEWVGRHARNGYALFKDPVTHRTDYAHRVAHALRRGPIAEGELILHQCDVSGLGAGCISPWHGWLGTQSDNMRNAAAKGFLARKLSASQVLEIRALRQANTVSRAAIAERFDTSAENVSLITSGRTWLHLLEPGAPPLSMARPWARTATCWRGHPRSENTSVYRNGLRRCRECVRLASERHRRLTSPKPAVPQKHLTPEIVRAIRAKAVPGVIDAALAREFGLAPATVNKIMRRLSWRHLDPDAPTPLASRARKVMCRRGHPFDEANTRSTADQRHCRTCARDATRKYRAKQPARAKQIHYNKLKAVCLRGHEFSGTILKSDGRPHRVCRTCQRDYGRAYYLARKAAA
jgi:hypothetical protein